MNSGNVKALAKCHWDEPGLGYAEMQRMCLGCSASQHEHLML